MGKIILSAFADEYNHDPHIHAAFLAKNNVSFIEPRFVNGENITVIAENKVKEYKKILDSYGVRVFSLGSPLGKINLQDDFAAHLDVARRCFENAKILDASRIRMFSFYLREGMSREDSRSEVMEKLNSLIELAEEYGLLLCHENEAKIYGENAECCLDIMKAFEGRIKCVFDMGNFVLDGVEPYPGTYNLLRDYIEYFHIKDSLYKGAIVPAGCGEASIYEILSDYSKNYERDVIVTLEPHLETFAGLNKLVGKAFENPYKFESGELAFESGLKALVKIIERIQ